MRTCRVCIGILAFSVGLWLSPGPSFSAATGDNGRCEIQGPTNVVAGQSFRLCGPSGSNWKYRWEGPGIDGSSQNRCLDVRGLRPGVHEFTLTTTKNRDRDNDDEGRGRDGDRDGDRRNDTQTCTIRVRVLSDGDNRGLCEISGPRTVDAFTRFELCTRDVEDATYRWSGQGVPSGSNERCLTFEDGLAPGTYHFGVRVERDDQRSECSFEVRVVSRGNGERTACPQPLRFWRALCAGDGGRDDDRHIIALEQDDLRHIAKCIDERTDVFTWDRDLASFCSLAEGSSKNRRTRLHQQFAALVANVCAWEHNLRDRNGNAIGIDPSTELTCGALDARTVDELLPWLEDLIDRSGKRDPVDRDAWRQLQRVSSCLERLNNGRGLAASRCGERDDDDRDSDDEAIHDATMLEDSPPTALELASLGSDETAQERLTPNPFSSFTRMQYSVAQNGERVEIGVYDLAGRLIHRLENGPKNAGTHAVRWNGADHAGSPVRAGMYFVRGSIGSRPLDLRVMYLK